LAPQLRRLALPVDEQLSRVIAAFDCLGERHHGDPVAKNVNGFLADRRYEPGLEHGISSTYLFIDPEVDPPLVGYATLTFDSVRLTNAEKRQMEDLIGIAEFGAVRIQMIGIDHHHQGTHCGVALLEAITGLARKLSQDVAVRFLLADANVRMVAWYEAAGFVANKSERERGRTDPERSVSMRLDLLKALHGSGDAEPQTDLVARAVAR
jgi:ribosomal protein S18 acetylase RimI-like enzyme